MKPALIVAVSSNQVIGRQGRLPWHLPEDLRRFKSLTMGHHLIMGRLTFESLGRCLPGRTTVVVSRSGPQLPAGALLAPSLDEAWETVRDDDEPFVIGGAAIFAAALPRIQTVYLTRVLQPFEGDTHFSLSFLDRGWQRIEQSGDQISRTSIAYRFEKYLLRRGPD